MEGGHTMITKIKLHELATYSNPVELSDLTEINFFFGSNGTGKTTISKLIADPDSYPTCAIEWQNGTPLKRIVYNEVFVRKVFYQSENFPGIFTIGEDAKEIEKKIKTKKEERERIENKITELKNTLNEKTTELNNKQNNFIDLCWEKVYKKYQDAFDEIFIGYRNSKKNFAARLLTEYSQNTSELQKIEYLTERYNLLYKEELNSIDELELISNKIINQFQNLENNQILKTKIIGKEDVDIAAMIKKLHNHDWVREGQQYFDKNYDEQRKTYICPFCQQATPDDFKEKLEEYFDETYENQIKELDRLLINYQNLSNQFNDYSEKLLLTQENKYFESKKEEIKKQIQLIKQAIENNLLKIKSKKEKPSEVVSIESTLELLEQINNLVDSVNQRVKEHNQIVINQENEKQKIDSEIWKFFCEEIKSLIESYNNDNNNINKAIENITNQIKVKDEQINEIKTEISELEKQTKSVKPTVEAINKLLDRFGFKGFKLKPTDDEKHYCIIREDGIIAKETLSEGERNFIIFLYFYHLVQGVLNPEENINEPKIVVFDDPVSSLDSDVLFIVATLIKDILRKVRNNEGNIKQVFVLTHNAFFFKEVTFISSRETQNNRKDTVYYVVRKSNNVSFIDSYNSNPIKTHYQLLWDEIKKEDCDCVNLQNSMRRIIEFYFKILANLDEEKLINKFNDEIEKKICRSLISWINVGSHDVFIDPEYVPATNEVEKFKEVFKKIFDETGQIEHYNMMMGIK